MISDDLASLLSDLEKFIFFSQEAEKCEEFEDAVEICESAANKLQSLLKDKEIKMDPQLKLNFEYNLQLATARKEWLLGTINAKKERPMFDSTDDSDSSSIHSVYGKATQKKSLKTDVPFTFLAPEDVPYVCWDAVIGIERAKLELQKALLTPLDFPDTAQAEDAATGILLFGVCNS